jgi:hypothetical protein
VVWTKFKLSFDARVKVNPRYSLGKIEIGHLRGGGSARETKARRTGTSPGPAGDMLSQRNQKRNK